MNKHGQGAFEYILLLAGILLVVIVSIVILRGGVLSTANNQIACSLETWFAVTSACAEFSNFTVDPSGDNATLNYCARLSLEDIKVYIYVGATCPRQSVIIFDGSVDGAYMHLSPNGMRLVLDIRGKTGSGLTPGQDYFIDLYNQGAKLLQNFQGSASGSVPTPPAGICGFCDENITSAGNIYGVPKTYCLQQDVNGNIDGVQFNSSASGGYLCCFNWKFNRTIPLHTNYGIFLNNLSNFTVVDCSATGYRAGLYANRSLNVVIQDGEFFNNDIGILFNPTNDSILSNVWAHHNGIFGMIAGSRQIEFASTSRPLSFLSKVSFLAPGLPVTAGILIENSSNNTISGSNVSYNYANGIFLYGSSGHSLLNNNATFNMLNGISLSTGSVNNTLTGNRANNNSDHGVEFAFASSSNYLTNNYACYNNVTSDDFIETTSPQAYAINSTCRLLRCSQEADDNHLCDPDTTGGSNCTFACP